MKNKPSNVIWVDFKSKRVINLSDLSHPAKPVHSIPYLCELKDKRLMKGGGNEKLCGYLGRW